MNNKLLHRVCVNQDQWLDIAPHSHTLEQVITTLAVGDKKVAVAVNNTIVSQAKWCDYHVKNNDQISVFGAIAGG